MPSMKDFTNAHGISEVVAGSDAAGISDWADAVVLTTASTNVSYTVPTGARWVRLTVTNPTWVKMGAVAAIPGASVLDGSAPVLLNWPIILPIPNGVTTIGLISATALAVVGIECWG